MFFYFFSFSPLKPERPGFFGPPGGCFPPLGPPPDPAAPDLQTRPDVVQSVVEDADRVRTRALLDEGEGVVDDLLRDALFAVEHDLVDQLLHRHAPVNGIGLDLLLRRRRASRHPSSLSYFFVPYFERPCLRLD